MAIDCDYTIEGEGPALFLIHGIGARRTGFAKIVDHLKEHFLCISYDLRGHGQSPIPEGRFGLDDLVDDIEALRSKLGIERAHFAGHSLGGMIGPAYARRFPDRVLSLGLLSTAAFRTEDDSAKVKGLGVMLREQGISAVLNTMTARWFTDEFGAARPDIIARRAQQVLDTPPEIFMNVFDIYAGTEMGPWLHEITAPALVITGELDGGCNPRLNRLIADALPNSELVILDGLKHAITLEAPDLVATHMLRFLTKHTSSGEVKTRAAGR